MATLTSTTTELEAEPPAPVHSSAYILVPVEDGVTASELLVALFPDQSPDAEHESASVELQVSVVVLPSSIAVGSAVKTSVGADGGGGGGGGGGA